MAVEAISGSGACDGGIDAIRYIQNVSVLMKERERGMDSNLLVEAKTNS